MKRTRLVQWPARFHEPEEGARGSWCGVDPVKCHKGSAPIVSWVARLVPWLLLLLLVAAALWHSQGLASAGLFQSGLATPTATAGQTLPTATADVPASPPASLTAMPTGLEASPVITPTASATPVTPATAATELPMASPPPSPASTATPRPAMPTSGALGSAESDRYPGDEADVRFDWSTLIDSFALALSYLWLACGIVALGLLVAWLVVRLLRGRRSKPH
jgi:hypothetical protein